MQIAPLESWLSGLQGPLIIAGPCSAETEEQVAATAAALRKMAGVRIFRAGLWKSRTRPDTFAGVGKAGLDWMRSVRTETGLLSAVEVSNAAQAEDCLRAGVDVLWVGARTTVNPFYVQEVADAVRGTGVAMMVKNPVSPDLDLWIGAVERLEKAGIRKMLAVHRGFSRYEKGIYRNAPYWEIAAEFKRLLPGMPMVCDPSHIAGKREYLQQIAQKALDMDMAGIMIETHLSPDRALSDSAQQITPKDLESLLARLVVRPPASAPARLGGRSEPLPLRLDEIDEALLALLVRRVEAVRQIEAFDGTELARSWRERGKALGLDEKFLDAIFRAIQSSERLS